jgi:hypothetical protein
MLSEDVMGLRPTSVNEKSLDSRFLAALSLWRSGRGNDQGAGMAT